MTEDIAISIINYRTADMTIAALTSVRAALGDRPARVVVVDNASGDGSADTIADWITSTADPRLQLVRSDFNSGFSGGHNQGMAAAPDADFYLILNSDAALRPGFFAALLEAAAAHPEAGLLAPQLEWEDGTPQISCFRFASPRSELERSAMSGPVTRLFKRYVTSLDMPVNPTEIEWMSFACILLRGGMVRQIGPMDEGYFLYFEDAEYSLRARRAGWGCDMSRKPAPFTIGEDRARSRRCVPAKAGSRCISGDPGRVSCVRLMALWARFWPILPGSRGGLWDGRVSCSVGRCH